jgi:hypothetical protein
MKVALIERLTDGKKMELRNLNEKEFLSRFTNITDKDAYNGFKATSNDVEYYITIVNY